MKEDLHKQLFRTFLLASIGALLGYVCALLILSIWHQTWSIDAFFLLKQSTVLFKNYPLEWKVSFSLVLIPVLGVLILSPCLFGHPLTRYGVTRWQSVWEMKRKHFFAHPGAAFLLGKMGEPHSRGKFVVSAKFPHCLLVAPTGSGKTVGFTLPNLLTFLGSAVVLDVKSECFEKTARHRAHLGHLVFRFSPTDYNVSTHCWNPLSRFERITNSAQRMAALHKLATLFLVAQSSQAESFLPNSKEVFVACAMLAYEKKNFTLGYIYQLVFGGEGGNNRKFANYAKLVKDETAKLIFNKMANTAPDTLSAYLSILSSSGFSPWFNPHICAVTEKSDFDFAEFRRQPSTVYFTVTSEDLPSIAPLVRMFFSEAIAVLQEKEPRKDEPFSVMFMLDEFQRLGRMPIIVESISLLRSYGGKVAIITQSIPDLDRVYGLEDRKTIQANSGIKLYLTPSEEDTIEELSESVGKTTKKVRTRSRTMKDGFLGVNITERTEEYPLLTKDDARRLPSDEIVIVVNGDMPIKAKRVQYFEDRILKRLYEAQDFSESFSSGKLITEKDYCKQGNMLSEDQDKNSSQRIALQKQTDCIYDRIRKLKTVTQE